MSKAAMHDQDIPKFTAIRLDYLRYLQVTGESAAGWLERLLSCKVTDLGIGQARLGCWCNIQGRAVAVVLVVRRIAAVDLILHHSLAATVAGQLRRYILREALYITEDPEPPVGVRFFVEVGEMAGSLPPDAAVLPWDRGRAIARDMPASITMTDETALMAWCRADLTAGVVWLSAPLSGLFLPQMLGLEALGAVDYGKGCYPGQEIIARAHHLGRVKKNAVRFTMQAIDLPPPGAKIRDAGGEERGTVIAACRGQNGIEGIAVLDRQASGGQLTCELAGHWVPLRHGN